MESPANDTISSFKSFLANKQAEEAIRLIEKDPAVLDLKDENGTSGYFLTIYSGQKDLIEHAQKAKKQFSFHEGIVAGKKTLVSTHLSQDKSLVNAYSNDGFTPLSLAAFFDQTEIALYLLEHGADPDKHASNPAKVNALHSAVAKQNLALCKAFIVSGVNVNAPQAQNATPLHSAAHLGNLELVKLLVEHGADVNVKMDNGMTPLDFARKYGHDSVVSYLSAHI